MTGFEPATTRPPDECATPALHPVLAMAYFFESTSSPNNNGQIGNGIVKYN